MPYSEASRAAFVAALNAELTVSGISAAQLAKEVGMAATTLRSQLGTSRVVPDPTTVFAIEAALGLPGGFLSQHLGYLPVGPVSPPAVGVLDALAADDRLRDDFKIALSEVYRSLLRRCSDSARRSSSSSKGKRAAAAMNKPARTR